MSRWVEWFESHPQVVVGIALSVVVVAIESYAEVSNWAKSLEQVRASESLGG